MNPKLYLSVLLISGALCACSWSNTNPYQHPSKSRTTQSQPAPESPTGHQSPSTAIREAGSRVRLDSDLLMQVLQRQIGRPYLYGGNSPTGFDCSGLVQYSFAQIGVDLPRSTVEQMAVLNEIHRDELQTGDLVFFKTGNKQFHVAVMTDEQSFIHAPSSGKTVNASSFANPYWRKTFIKAARY